MSDTYTVIGFKDDAGAAEPVPYVGVFVALSPEEAAEACLDQHGDNVVVLAVVEGTPHVTPIYD